MKNGKKVIVTDLAGGKHEVPVSELTWRPSVYGIVIRGGKILLCRHFGKYNLPGGGLDFGESIEEGLKREVAEETGIKVARPRLIAADSDLFKPPFGAAPIQSLLLYFECEAVGGRLSTDGFDEDEQRYAELAQWVPIDTIDDWQITSSKDFRPHVKAVINKQPQ